MRVTAAAGHVLNLLLVLRVLAAPRLLRGPHLAVNSTCLLVFVYRLFTVCLRTLEAWVVCSQTVLFTNSLFSCLFTELRS